MRELAGGWRGDRPARQQRRHLDRADFDALRDLGFLRLAVPVDCGGSWVSVTASTRGICDVLRTLAAADPSVALVSSMHPSVVGFWVCKPDASQPAWEEQRRAVFETARDGEQWGTITSEPGSGGDISKTATAAAPDDGPATSLPGASYRLSGDKHFGSGMGVTSYMITTALPADSSEPSLFAVDVRQRAWDGSDGLHLIAEWDGAGMAATQSHAMRLQGCPATRLAYDGKVDDLTVAAAPLIANLFTAVVLGVLDEAVQTARVQLAPKASGMRAYEQVEWSRAEMDHWLAVQAFEGSLRAVESGDHGAGVYAAIRAKECVAELAESCLQRLCRVIGGGTFARRSPYSAWYEDVRALGFLRPPWGLAYDTLLMTSWMGA